MPQAFERLIWGAAGLLVGWAAAWLWAQRRVAAVAALEGELRRTVAAREAALALAQTDAVQAREARAGAESARQSAELWSADRARAVAELSTAAEAVRDRLTVAEAELAAARRELETQAAQALEQRRTHAAQIADLTARQTAALEELRISGERQLEAVRLQFKALAAEALAAQNPEFLRLAQEKLGQFQQAAAGDLERRQDGVAALLQPLQETLRAYQARLQQSEAQQQTALEGVRQQLERLRTDSLSLAGATQRLREVLQSNQARGRWGEETLRRVVEAAGLSAHCDFSEQEQEGDSKPDMVVRLPGDRLIVVDSKVPDLDFLNSLSQSEDASRGEILKRHARGVRERVQELSQRNYPGQFANALDYVVLFVPAESLFSAALEGDRNLIVWAAERRVLLATPASLIALLRSVSVSWQQHEQSRNAQEIAREAGDLLKRLQVFAGHFEKLRKGVASAAEAFNDALASFETRVRPSAERLVQLGVRSEKELPRAEPVLLQLRSDPF